MDEQAINEKKQTREIDGTTYEAWPVPFGVGRPALVRLVKIASPIIEGVARGRELGWGEVAGLFSALPSAFTDDDLVYFARIFGNASRYKGTDANSVEAWIPLVERNHAAHFAERYHVFLQWLVFHLEVNFTSFFVGMRGADFGLLRKMMAPSPSK